MYQLLCGLHERQSMAILFPKSLRDNETITGPSDFFIVTDHCIVGRMGHLGL